MHVYHNNYEIYSISIKIWCAFSMAQPNDFYNQFLCFFCYSCRISHAITYVFLRFFFFSRAFKNPLNQTGPECVSSCLFHHEGDRVFMLMQVAISSYICGRANPASICPPLYFWQSWTRQISILK
jgi:hypothetical protein